MHQIVDYVRRSCYQGEPKEEVVLELLAFRDACLCCVFVDWVVIDDKCDAELVLFT